MLMLLKKKKKINLKSLDHHLKSITKLYLLKTHLIVEPLKHILLARFVKIANILYRVH